jgi:HK97 family phage prohead protease
MGDVIDPLGAVFEDEIPLLWQHDSSKPIGRAALGPASENGIPFTARIPIIDEPGQLQDRVAEALQSLKLGIVGAVSIGFRPIGRPTNRNDGAGLEFGAIEILELSLVTIPANADATIEPAKAASGNRSRQSVVVRLGDRRGRGRASAPRRAGAVYL